MVNTFWGFFYGKALFASGVMAGVQPGGHVSWLKHSCGGLD